MDTASLIWPVLRRHWPAGTYLHDGELCGCSECVRQDRQLCIDAAACPPRRYRREPLAVRIQRGTCFRTFTIRATRSDGEPTELDKLQLASVCGWAGPMWHVQAFIPQPGSMVVGVALTSDLLWVINAGQSHQRTNGQDGNTFHVIGWDQLHPSRVWEYGS